MVGFRVLFVPRTAARVVVIEYGVACMSVLQLIVFQGLSGTGKGTTTAKLKVGWGPLPRDAWRYRRACSETWLRQAWHCGVVDCGMHACACAQERIPNTVCWSNGNLFRSLTLLAVTHLEKAGIVRVAVAGQRVGQWC